MNDPALLIVAGLIAHLWGDYILQSDWMAFEKEGAWLPAIVHGLIHGLLFLILTRSPVALVVIVGTHIVIDHYRLARRVYWLKSRLGPPSYRVPWRDVRAEWTWLMIVIDNTMHITINSAALLWL